MSGHAETQARLSHVKSTALAHQIRVSLRWRRLPPKNASNDGTADARPSISQIKANTGVCVIKVVQTSTTSLDICSFTHSIDIIKHAICTWLDRLKASTFTYWPPSCRSTLFSSTTTTSVGLRHAPAALTVLASPASASVKCPPRPSSKCD
ncbi:hypothetical protein PISMIDRAFT_369086 [Pisolithus microcarpus 441]|uniref:Uncharacterized protein n=1 Tax=Pisolithus microcarpus 441 TaxID=765257 RepID=A0A0C9ZZ21_9AGAM|nr:hypothetical protein PISMIDRAFT_369086 [Pisolithus microcarpus 441]